VPPAEPISKTAASVPLKSEKDVWLLKRNSKYTDEQRAAVLKLYDQAKYTYDQISKMTGVGKGTCAYVVYARKHGLTKIHSDASRVSPPSRDSATSTGGEE